MVTAVVLGATGYAGGHITRELASRGHRVIAVARNAESTAQENVTVRSGSVHDAAFVDEVVKGADVVIVSIHASPEDEGRRLIDAFPHLLAAAKANGARLGVVGGAGSLLISEGGPRLVDGEEFPPQAKPEALAHSEVLALLRADESGAEWFYVSPAATFGAWNPGERTGTFRIGGDVLLLDDKGESAISGADLAIAIADEVEEPRHSCTRFSIAY